MDPLDMLTWTLYILRPRQNGFSLANDIFEYFCLESKLLYILIQISLELVPKFGSKSSLIQIVVLRIPDNTLPEAIVWPMCMIFGVTRLQWVKQDEWFREMNMRFDPLSVSPCLSWCSGGVIEQFVVRLPVPSVDIIPVYSRDRCRLQHPPWIHQDVISQCQGDHSAMNLWARLSWGENSSKCCQINGGCVIWQNYSRRTWPEVDACVTFGKCHQKFVITLHTVCKIVFISLIQIFQLSLPILRGVFKPYSKISMQCTDNYDKNA